MLGKLAPHHREKLASLIAGTPEFSPDDAEVALELVDAALGHPDSDEYRFILFEEADRVLGFACFGSASMAEGQLRSLLDGRRRRGAATRNRTRAPRRGRARASRRRSAG